MYQNIYFEVKKQKIHLWDDKKGYLVIPYKKYAYIKNQTGLHYTLDGDKVKKIYDWDKDTRGLYEADVPQTTRFLIDQYLRDIVNYFLILRLKLQRDFLM